MLRHFEEDEAHCVYCHAPASGPCARCHALICVDCAVIAEGSVARAAICTRCDAKGTAQPGLWSLLRWPLIALAALVAITLLLEWATR